MPIIKQVAKQVKKAISKIGKEINGYQLYDYSDKDSREATAEYLYQYAKTQRHTQEKKWREQDRYYNNDHVVQAETYKFCQDNNIPWVPAVIPDPYIHVESQIIPDVPEFQFNGRDDDADSKKAKQREYVVKYVLEQNKIDTMNTENERTLGKHGNAMWKVSWNASKFYGGTFGDIDVGNPDVSNIFPDPAATDIDDCEYIDYSYPMHRLKAGRVFAKQLAKLKITLDDIRIGTNRQDTQIYNTDTHDVQLDTVQIVEHWFRQPLDGKGKMEIEVDGKLHTINVEWEAGDIACSININGTEVQYIPKYWMKTGNQNKIYPFVKYCKIPIRKSFWDKSELDTIKELVDSADRELAMAILNDTFTSNDMIIVEEGSLAEDSAIVNEPGHIVKMKQGYINSIRRLGGIQSGKGLLEMVNAIREIIQQTIGNFDSSMGSEPIRVTTASGIAQLNERADARKNIKKADRISGFERLFELIDWTALEFYDDDRMIFIGAKKEGEKPIASFNYNSDNSRVYSDFTNEYYYPRVDAVVNAGDGMQKSKSFVLATTENLISKPINVSNYKIVQEMLDIMDTPNKQEIKDFYEQLYGPELALKNLNIEKQIEMIQNPPIPQPQTPTEGGNNNSMLNDVMGGLSKEHLDHLSSDPDLMEQVHAIVGG